MYIIKVLGVEHENEVLEDLFVDLLKEAEIWFAVYVSSEYGSGEEENSKKKYKAYERACLECFRLAILKK